MANSRSAPLKCDVHMYGHYYSIIPDGWAASGGGFPTMTEHVAFLMKDIVLFSASVYLLRQDILRVSGPAKQNRESSAVVLSH